MFLLAEHRNLDEELFELVIKKAVIDETDNECEVIYEKYKDSAEPHYSKSHQRRIEKLIRSSIKKEKRNGHWIRNVVAVFIAVVAIGASTLSVDAVRAKVSAWISSISGHINISADYKKYVPEGWVGAWFLHDTPVEMSIREYMSTSESLYLFYIDSDGKETTLFQTLSDQQFAIDGDASSAQTVYIHNSPGLIISSDNQYCVYWSSDDWHFVLFSPYDYETSLQLAKKLNYIKLL